MQAFFKSGGGGGVDPRRPIATALAGAAKKLRAFAYVPTIADTVEAALAYRENFSSRELMPIHGDWTAWDNWEDPEERESLH